MKTEFPVKLRKKPGQKVILFFVLSWAAGFSLSVLDMNPAAAKDFSDMLAARDDISPAVRALLLRFDFWSSFFYWLPIVTVGGSFLMRHWPTCLHIFAYIREEDKRGDDFPTFIEKALEQELEKNRQALTQLQQDVDQERNYGSRSGKTRKLEKALERWTRYEEKRRWQIEDQLRFLKEERKLLL